MAFVGVKHKRQGVTIEVRLNDSEVPPVDAAKFRAFIGEELDKILAIPSPQRGTTEQIALQLATLAIAKYENLPRPPMWADCTISTDEITVMHAKESQYVNV